MWDIPVPQEIDRYDTERLRSVLADLIRLRLSPGKQLLRVVSWCPDTGLLFRPRLGVRCFAVAYEVALGA